MELKKQSPSETVDRNLSDTAKKSICLTVSPTPKKWKHSCIIDTKLPDLPVGFLFSLSFLFFIVYCNFFCLRSHGLFLHDSLHSFHASFDYI